MPNLKKLISKLNKSEAKIAEFLIEEIISFDWRALDIKKLKGYQNLFRARKGKIRIIFSKDGNKKVFILSIEHRGKDTYKF